jgi:OmpR-family two-component system manganese-sensing response regulator
MRILVIDDEVELANALGRCLKQAGYDVDLVHTGSMALQLLSDSGYDLLILDWMLPDLSGLQICQDQRQKGNSTPVLFLTARDTLDDRVQGLDAGADDYLIKPFELRELMARVRALLRRSGTSSASVSYARLQAEGVDLDPENQVAYYKDHVISLSEKETQLLHLFMQNPGQLLTHEQICQHLWPGGDPPSSNVLVAQIRLLRRKLEGSHADSSLIQTVYGKGYRFGIPRKGEL